MQDYKITEDSPALEYHKTVNKEKKDLPGIESYDIKGIKMDLRANSIILKKKYI
jgi:hypothetical protein